MAWHSYREISVGLELPMTGHSRREARQHHAEKALCLFKQNERMNKSRGRRDTIPYSKET